MDFPEDAPSLFYKRRSSILKQTRLMGSENFSEYDTTRTQLMTNREEAQRNLTNDISRSQRRVSFNSEVKQCVYVVPTPNQDSTTSSVRSQPNELIEQRTINWFKPEFDVGKALLEKQSNQQFEPTSNVLSLGFDAASSGNREDVGLNRSVYFPEGDDDMEMSLSACELPDKSIYFRSGFNDMSLTACEDASIAQPWMPDDDDVFDKENEAPAATASLLQPQPSDMSFASVLEHSLIQLGTTTTTWSNQPMSQRSPAKSSSSQLIHNVNQNFPNVYQQHNSSFKQENVVQRVNSSSRQIFTSKIVQQSTQSMQIELDLPSEADFDVKISACEQNSAVNSQSNVMLTKYSQQEITFDEQKGSETSFRDVQRGKSPFKHVQAEVVSTKISRDTSVTQTAFAIPSETPSKSVQRQDSYLKLCRDGVEASFSNNQQVISSSKVSRAQIAEQNRPELGSGTLFKYPGLESSSSNQTGDRMGTGTIQIPCEIQPGSFIHPAGPQIQCKQDNEQANPFFNQSGEISGTFKMPSEVPHHRTGTKILCESVLMDCEEPNLSTKQAEVRTATEIFTVPDGTLARTEIQFESLLVDREETNSTCKHTETISKNQIATEIPLEKRLQPAVSFHESTAMQIQCTNLSSNNHLKQIFQSDDTLGNCWTDGDRIAEAGEQRTQPNTNYITNISRLQIEARRDVVDAAAADGEKYEDLMNISYPENSFDSVQTTVTETKATKEENLMEPKQQVEDRADVDLEGMKQADEMVRRSRRLTYILNQLNATKVDEKTFIKRGNEDDEKSTDIGRDLDKVSEELGEKMSINCENEDVRVDENAVNPDSEAKPCQIDDVSAEKAENSEEKVDNESPTSGKQSTEELISAKRAIEEPQAASPQQPTVKKSKVVIPTKIPVAALGSHEKRCSRLLLSSSKIKSKTDKLNIRRTRGVGKETEKTQVECTPSTASKNWGPESTPSTFTEQSRPDITPSMSANNWRHNSKSSTVTKDLRPEITPCTSTKDLRPESKHSTVTKDLRPEITPCTSTKNLRPQSKLSTVTEDLRPDITPCTSTKDLRPQSKSSTVTEDLRPEITPCTSTKDLRPQSKPSIVTKDLRPKITPCTATENLRPESKPSTVTKDLRPEITPCTSTKDLRPQSKPSTVTKDLRPDITPSILTDDLIPESTIKTVTKILEPEVTASTSGGISNIVEPGACEPMEESAEAEEMAEAASAPENQTNSTRKRVASSVSLATTHSDIQQKFPRVMQMNELIRVQERKKEENVINSYGELLRKLEIENMKSEQRIKERGEALKELQAMCAEVRERLDKSGKFISKYLPREETFLMKTVLTSCNEPSLIEVEVKVWSRWKVKVSLWKSAIKLKLKLGDKVEQPTAGQWNEIENRAVLSIDKVFSLQSANGDVMKEKAQKMLWKAVENMNHLFNACKTTHDFMEILTILGDFVIRSKLFYLDLEWVKIRHSLELVDERAKVGFVNKVSSEKFSLSIKVSLDMYSSNGPGVANDETKPITVSGTVSETDVRRVTSSVSTGRSYLRDVVAAVDDWIFISNGYKW